MARGCAGAAVRGAGVDSVVKSLRLPLGWLMRPVRAVLVAPPEDSRNLLPLLMSRPCAEAGIGATVASMMMMAMIVRFIGM